MTLLDFIDNFLAKISMPPCPDGTHFHPGINRCHKSEILHQKSKIAHGTIKKPLGKLQKQQINRAPGQPPGPPPRPGLQWKRETSRWIRPQSEEADDRAHSEVNKIQEAGIMTPRENAIANSILEQYKQKGHLSDKQWDVLHNIHEKYAKIAEKNLQSPAIIGNNAYVPTQQDSIALKHLQKIARPIKFSTTNRDLNAMHSLLDAYEKNKQLSEKQWSYVRTLAKKMKNVTPPSDKEIKEQYDYSIREFRQARSVGNDERAFEFLEQSKAIREKYKDVFAQ